MGARDLTRDLLKIPSLQGRKWNLGSVSEDDKTTKYIKQKPGGNYYVSKTKRDN
jgi:hypothetical protein